MPRYTPYTSLAPSHSAQSDPRSPRIPWPTQSSTPTRNVTFGRSIRRSLHYDSFEDVAAFSPLSSPLTNIFTSPGPTTANDEDRGIEVDSESEGPVCQLSLSRINKAIDIATSAATKAEAGYDELLNMRDQQARFVNQQKTVLTRLELEADKVEDELQGLQMEMLRLESEVAQIKGAQCNSRDKTPGNGEAPEGLGRTIRYKLRRRA